jgi:AmmeMemoRadiSam system protein A
MHLLSDPLLSDEDRRALLARARRAIFETVSCLSFPDLPPAAGRLAEPGGAFVTLRCNGRLRGCIGRTAAAHALAETVVQCAITAALQDPRFKPLRAEEMAGLEIEISVVSEPRPVRPEEIELGIHGILVSRGASRGLLLPQVAREHNWSATQFLEAACRKARLGAGAWRDPETKLFAFTAEVFSEISLVPLDEQPAGRQIQRPA